VPPARPSPRVDPQQREPLNPDAGAWRISDGVLFSVTSSLVLWGLIVAGLHATLT
jgi:hypothetical protein